MARRIVFYVATSADGYIARPDGGVEWLDRPRAAGDYGMAGFARSVDAIVLGRKTFDVARKLGERFAWSVPVFVFSRARRGSPMPGVRFVRERVGAFARKLRAEKGKDVWLMGGADLAAAFLEAGELDEIVVHAVPTLIGDGIPLFRPRRRSVALKLLSSRAFQDGVVRLRYAVVRAPRRRRRTARVRRG